MKAAIAHFKAYLQRRYPDRSTGKHYISDLTIFSQFVGKTSPRDITVKTIDAFVQAQLIAALPAWLAQAVQPYMRRRMARWSDHRLQPAG